MSYTSPRNAVNAVVALAHQSAFGTAASSAGTVVRAPCSDVEILRGGQDIDPYGSEGTEYEPDNRYEVATAPRASFRCRALNRQFLAFLLEYATHGQPTSTAANSDLTESGDTDGVLATWVLNGIRPGFNTDSASKLYVKLTDESPGAGEALVQVYSDSARTALVASGSAANGATVTLAAQNSSGLSGTVALGTVTASNLTGIVLQITRVRPQRSSAIARFFTMFLDTGSELMTLSGCAIRSIRFESAGRGGIAIQVDVWAGAFAIGASVFTPTSVAYEQEGFAHGGATVTFNSVSESVKSVAFGLEHDLVLDDAQMTAPVGIWSRGSIVTPVEVVQRLSDESRVMRDDGAAGTWRAFSVNYAFAAVGKDFLASFPRARVVDAELPAMTGAEWSDHRHTLIARDNGTDAPVAFTLEM